MASHLAFGDADNVVSLGQSKVACEDCSLFQLCLPVGISGDELAELDKIIQRRQPLKRGETLYQAGEPFKAIYAVRSGSLKSFSITDDGVEQVTGFHLPGELLGLEAINLQYHPCSARALEGTSFCEIPFDRLEELSHHLPGLHHQLLKIMSKEILHDHNLLTLLGKRSAEERLAALMLSLSGRFKQRGFSATDFYLSMSRSDIASYLGLAVETVSRLFTRFQEDGLLEVQRKHITITDLARLKQMSNTRQAEKPKFIGQI